MNNVYFKNRYLFKELVKKDIKAKYEGTIFGIVWSMMLPLIMLAIYTFVFSEVFNVRWGTEIDNNFSFALTLFCGLILYNMFSEILNRSVNLIASNANYVKKVVFPVEILPSVTTFSAFFNCVMSYVILIVANVFLTGSISVVIWQAAIILIPFVFYCQGLAYLVSAISVYIKDFANVNTVIITAGMYVSPIFFPLESLPEDFKFVIMLNPMTYSIENMRNVILYNQNLDINYLVISILTAIIAHFIGEKIFLRAKIGFADLL